MVILNTILNATLGDDYYPKTEKIHDSGNHANLNYQIIADRQTRKLTILIVVILLYLPSLIFTICTRHKTVTVMRMIIMVE